MIDRKDLKSIAESRLGEAQILLKSRKYDGAVYLCGYSVEIALKRKICQTLNWDSFPDTSGEFDGLRDFRTHDLEMLLRLSGKEKELKSKNDLYAKWQLILSKWDEGIRYRPIGSVKKVEATETIEACTKIFKFLEDES